MEQRGTARPGRSGTGPRTSIPTATLHPIYDAVDRRRRLGARHTLPMLVARPPALDRSAATGWRCSCRCSAPSAAAFAAGRWLAGRRRSRAGLAAPSGSCGSAHRWSIYALDFWEHALGRGLHASARWRCSRRDRRRRAVRWPSRWRAGALLGVGGHACAPRRSSTPLVAVGASPPCAARSQRRRVWSPRVGARRARGRGLRRPVGRRTARSRAWLGGHLAGRPGLGRRPPARRRPAGRSGRGGARHAPRRCVPATRRRGAAAGRGRCVARRRGSIVLDRRGDGRAAGWLLAAAVVACSVLARLAGRPRVRARALLGRRRSRSAALVVLPTGSRELAASLAVAVVAAPAGVGASSTSGGAGPQWGGRYVARARASCLVAVGVAGAPAGRAARSASGGRWPLGRARHPDRASLWLRERIARGRPICFADARGRPEDVVDRRGTASSIREGGAAVRSTSAAGSTARSGRRRTSSAPPTWSTEAGLDDLRRASTERPDDAARRLVGDASPRRPLTSSVVGDPSYLHSYAPVSEHAFVRVPVAGSLVAMSDSLDRPRAPASTTSRTSASSCRATS